MLWTNCYQFMRKLSSSLLKAEKKRRMRSDLTMQTTTHFAKEIVNFSKYKEGTSFDTFFRVIILPKFYSYFEADITCRCTVSPARVNQYFGSRHRLKMEEIKFLLNILKNLGYIQRTRRGYIFFKDRFDKLEKP